MQIPGLGIPSKGSTERKEGTLALRTLGMGVLNRRGQGWGPAHTPPSELSKPHQPRTCKFTVQSAVPEASRMRGGWWERLSTAPICMSPLENCPFSAFAHLLTCLWVSLFSFLRPLCILTSHTPPARISLSSHGCLFTPAIFSFAVQDLCHQAQYLFVSSSYCPLSYWSSNQKNLWLHLILKWFCFAFLFDPFWIDFFCTRQERRSHSILPRVDIQLPRHLLLKRLFSSMYVFSAVVKRQVVVAVRAYFWLRCTPWSCVWS